MPRLNSFAGSGIIGGTLGSSAGSNNNALGAVSQLGSYGVRNFDIHGDNLAVWKRGSGDLELYSDLIGSAPGATEIYSPTDTSSVSTTGQDDQGWYQCAMNDSQIYLGKPFGGTNNAGVLDIHNWTTAGLGSSATGNTRSTGALSSNNFGFYKLSVLSYADLVYSQDGATGHRVYLTRNRTTSNTDGDFQGGSSTSSISRATRGIASFHTADGGTNPHWHTYGYVSGNRAFMQMLKWEGTSNTIQDIVNFQIDGEGAEVCRHTRMTEITSVNGQALAEPRYIILGSGSSAGMQVREWTNAASTTVSVFADFTGSEWSTDGGIAAYNDIVVVNGIVYRWSNIDTTPTLVEIDNLLDKIPASGVRGITRMNESIIAVGANNSRIYLFENIY